MVCLGAFRVARLSSSSDGSWVYDIARDNEIRINSDFLNSVLTNSLFLAYTVQEQHTKRHASIPKKLRFYYNLWIYPVYVMQIHQRFDLHLFALRKALPSGKQAWRGAPGERSAFQETFESLVLTVLQRVEPCCSSVRSTTTDVCICEIEKEPTHTAGCGAFIKYVFLQWFDTFESPSPS